MSGLPPGVDPASLGGAGAGLGAGAGAGLLPMSFDNTLGALIIGGLACCCLYGITCLQTAIYFLRYPHDRAFLRALVFALWTLDTFDTILTSHVMYHYFVSNYANPLAIFKPVWSLILHVAVTSVCDFTVRSMFARRVWRLSNGNWLLTGFIVVVSITDLVVGLMITVKAFGISSFPELSKVSTLFYLNFASGITGDFSVALVLCYYLFKSKTGFNKTDSLLKTLIAYSVTTGLLTAFDASAGLICYAVMPNNLVFIAFYLQLGKLYLNSYLASLNLRQRLLGSMKSTDGMVSIHLSRVQPSFNKDASSGSGSATYSQYGGYGPTVSGGYGASGGYGVGAGGDRGYAQVRDSAALERRGTLDRDVKDGEKERERERERSNGGSGRWSGRVSRMGKGDGSKDGHDLLDSPMEIKVETTVETETETLDQLDMNEEPLPHFTYDRPHRARQSQGQTGYAV